MALIPLLTLEIRSEHDVVLARQRARQIAEGLGLDHQNQIKLGTAVSEIVRNAFRYAGGGRTSFSLDDATPSSLLIEVADRGPGIADLAAVLEGRYHSTTGLGLGLIGVRRLMEVCDIASAPGEGTRVTMRKYIPALVGRRQLMTVASQLAEAFVRDQRNDPVAEVQYQNQELLRTLSELRARQDELEQLNHELEDTNRGVVALHAELDVRADHLRRASRTKSRFLSNMTHEFRTPLNSIQALANLLLDNTDGELSPEQRRQVTFIRRSCEQLAELVDDLLDLAKVEAGKVAVKASPNRDRCTTTETAARSSLNRSPNRHTARHPANAVPTVRHAVARRATRRSASRKHPLKCLSQSGRCPWPKAEVRSSHRWRGGLRFACLFRAKARDFWLPAYSR